MCRIDPGKIMGRNDLNKQRGFHVLNVHVHTSRQNTKHTVEVSLKKIYIDSESDDFPVNSLPGSGDVPSDTQRLPDPGDPKCPE